MVDWPGLLKWSLKFQDSASSGKDIKPMDEATRKWLEEALKAHSVDHITQIKEIIETLSAKKYDSTEVLLENLSDLIENLDAGLIFCQSNGMPLLIDIILNDKDKKARWLACQIFQSIVQNSKENQRVAYEVGGFKLIERIFNEEDVKNKEIALSALSALIRGEFLVAKQAFVNECDGVEFLKKLYIEYGFSEKIRVKTLFLLKDLVFYDDKEKNIVKKKIIEVNFNEIFMEIVKDSSKTFIEGRNAMAYMMIQILKAGFKGEFNKGIWGELLKNHENEIQKQNALCQGIYDNEIVVMKELKQEFN